MNPTLVKPLALLGVAAAGLALSQKARVDLLEPSILAKQPNVACLKGSPFGRTMGLALQGPIVKFWDKGIGNVEAGATTGEGGAFGDWVASLNDMRNEPAKTARHSKLQERHIMAKIEKRLSLAWQMDPRNYSNYSIYQMFLFESFTDHGANGARAAKDLSKSTIQFCASDEGSPYSMLTGAQAAFDLVVTGSIFAEAFDGGPSEIVAYSQYVPEFLNRYENVIAEMKEDGRWDRISIYRQEEMEQRAVYLRTLQNHTQGLIQRITGNDENVEGGHRS